MAEGEEVVYGVKRFSLATSGHHVLACAAGKVWGEALHKSAVCTYTVQDGRITPSAVHAIKTPTSHDLVTIIAVTKSGERGWAGFRSGRVSPFGSSVATDCSWAAHTTEVTAMAVLETKNKALLWTGAADGLLRIWDGAKLAGKVAGHRGDVLDAVHVPFASSGGVMWTAGKDKTIRVWEKSGAAASGWTRRPTALKCGDVPTALAVDAVRQVVWSSEKGAVRGWSADTRTCVWASARGGLSVAVCGRHVACLSETGNYIFVWDAAVGEKVKTEVAAATAIPTHDKGALRLATVPTAQGGLLLSGEKGLAVVAIEAHTVDPSRELVMYKAADESVGAIFRSDASLVLEKVEPKSSAERCGASRFLGWCLETVNGVHVKTVADVRVAVRKQSTLSLTFSHVSNGSLNSLPRGANNSITSPPVSPPQAPKTVTPAMRRADLRRQTSPETRALEAAPAGGTVPARRTSPVKRSRKASGATAPVPEWLQELAAVVRRHVRGDVGDDDLPAALDAYIGGLAEREARARQTAEECEERLAAQDTAHAAQLVELSATHDGVLQAKDAQLEAQSSGMRDRIREEVEASLHRLVTPSMHAILASLGVSSPGSDAHPAPARPSNTVDNHTFNNSSIASHLSPPGPGGAPRAYVAQGSDASFEQLEQEAKEYSMNLHRLPPRASHVSQTDASTESLPAYPSPPPAGGGRRSGSTSQLRSSSRSPGGADPRVSAAAAAEKVQEALDMLAPAPGTGGDLLSDLRRIQSQLARRTDSAAHDDYTLADSRGAVARASSHLSGSAVASPPAHLHLRRHRSGSHHTDDRDAPPPPTDLRKSSPAPLTHGTGGSGTGDDATWTRVFELKNRVEQWLKQKPDQIHQRVVQLEREAHAEGIAAVRRAIAEFDDYCDGERREYSESCAALKDDLEPVSPHATDNIDAAWQQLEAAEDMFTAAISKLREELEDTKAQAAAMRARIKEFRDFVEDGGRSHDAAAKEFASEKIADADLRDALLSVLGLDLWCQARRHVHTAARIAAELERAPQDPHYAAAKGELDVARAAWGTLEKQLVTEVPTGELDAASDEVWALLELAKAAVRSEVSSQLAFAASSKVQQVVLPALQQRLARMTDADPDDDLLPALETLCDEIQRYYSLGLTPLLELNGKLAAETGDFADVLYADLKRSCKLRSHHVHRTQLYPTQIAHILQRAAREEFGAGAVGLSESTIDEYLSASLTKGGSMVVMVTFCQLVAHQLLKANANRSTAHYSLESSPRTSLDALVIFYNTRVAQHGHGHGHAHADGGDGGHSVVDGGALEHARHRDPYAGPRTIEF